MIFEKGFAKASFETPTTINMIDEDWIFYGR